MIIKFANAVPPTPIPLKKVSLKTLYTIAKSKQELNVREYFEIFWKNVPIGVRRAICPKISGNITTKPSLLRVLNNEIPDFLAPFYVQV